MESEPIMRSTTSPLARLLLAPIAAALLLTLAAARPAAAQDGAPPAGDAAPAAGADDTARAIERLLEKIEDPERRSALVGDLRTLLAAERAAAPDAAAAPPKEKSLVGGLVAFATGLADRIRETSIELVTQVSRLPAHFRDLGAKLEDAESRSALLFDAGAGLSILVAAWLLSAAIFSMLKRPRRALESPPEGTAVGPVGRLFRLLGVAVLGLAPTAAFFGLVFVGLAVVRPRADGRLIVLAFAWAAVLKRVTVTAVRVMFSPRAAAIRLAPVSDETALAVEKWTARLAGMAAYGYFLLQAATIIGAEEALLVALGNVYGLVLLVAGILLVLRLRARVTQGLAAWIEPDPAEPRKAWRSAASSLASAWWIAAIAYEIGIFVAWASGSGDFSTIVRATVASVLLVSAGAFSFALLDWLASRLSRRTAGLSGRYPELAGPAGRYVKGIEIAVKVLLGIVVAAFVLEAWGVAALGVLESAFVSAAFSAIVGILFVVLIAAAVIDVSTMLTQRYLEAKERAGLASNKTRTILPLARKAIKVVVVTIAFVTSLSQAGVDVAPILAGVGVIGLAIGFGAQTLVKDIITGLFILMEDTISVGEVIEVNGTGGLVESVNIRTVRLRDLTGSVHTIPYSSINAVKNMTRDFSYYLARVGVAYKEDVDRVIAVIREVAGGMQKEPEYGKDILEAIDIQGLDKFDDSAIVIQCRIKTKPIQQWRIGREFNRRLKKAFDEKGIEIPFPQRTVWFAGNGAVPTRSIEARAGARESAG